MEGRRQKAESRRQKVEGSEKPLCLDCLLPTAFCLLFFAASPRLRVSLSSWGRALLVAALLISAYTLARYWRSLDGRSNRVRLSLVGLRAITLVLMSCALAGVQVEYQTTRRARVLLSSTRAAASTDGKSRKQEAGAGSRREQIVEQAIAALKGKDFEVAEQNDERAVEATGNLDELNGKTGFVAAALLSDGAMSALDARREVEKTSERAGGAPVYVIAEDGQSEGASVALESVTLLGRAVRGVPVAVRCTVHARGMKGRESLVTITDEAKVQASARITWTKDDERQAVTLTVVPKVAGWIDYTAKVEAAGSEDAARLTRPFSLFVEERRWRVLFFESEPTWEAKFIRRALEQSRLFDVDYFAQVSRAAIVGASEEAKEQQETASKDETVRNGNAGSTPEAKLHAALQSAARLNLYDCVIVGATENTLLSPAESARLREWVERRGGGLIVLGGNSFNGSIAAPGGKLYSLLPTEISAQGFVSQAQELSQGRPLEAEKTRDHSFLTPTEEGANALGGYLSASEETNAKVAALTGQGFRLGALRPGAGVLAVAGQPGANGTSEEGVTEIAGIRYGAGRTLVFAPADSWRIRTSAGVEEDNAGGPFNALWQGLVLWASADAREPSEIALSDESPAEGSTLTAELRVRDASYTPLKIEKLNARLQPLTEDTGDASTVAAQPPEVAFAPDTTDASVWRAQFLLRGRGRFALEVNYVAGGQTGSVEKQFAVVAPMPHETGASLDTLRRASRETGGDLIIANEIDALAERLATASSNAETVRRIWELRTWWPLAFIIPLLLSTEWFARRWWKED
jgi:hypothetical protein